MNTADKKAAVTQSFQNFGAYASHDPHITNHIGRVRNLYSNLGYRRTNWTHAKWNDVHGAPLHTPIIDLKQLALHFTWRLPIIGGPRILRIDRADKGPALNTRHISGIGSKKETIGTLLLIQSNGDTCILHLVHQGIVLLLRTISPVHVVWFTDSFHIFYPFKEAAVFCGRLHFD